MDIVLLKLLLGENGVSESFVATSLVSLIFFSITWNQNIVKGEHLCTDAQILEQMDMQHQGNNELYETAFNSGSEYLDTAYFPPT